MGGKRKQFSAPYLGRLKLHWCNRENIPILEKKICPLCKSPTKFVTLTPPGDVKPAFNIEIERIRNAIDEYAGEGFGNRMIPEGTAVLLNKIPGADYTAEVIVGGYIIGLFYFEPIEKKFLFRPRKAGGIAMAEIGREKGVPPQHTIELKPEAVKYILDGKSILIPGVKRVIGSVKKGDYYIVLSEGNFITMATSVIGQKEFEEMMNGGRGKLAKNLRRERNIEEKKEILKELEKQPPVTVISEKGRYPLPPIWEIIFRANKEHIDGLVKEAEKFIKYTVRKYGTDIPKAVAYSGGKDSQCVLLLVYRTLGPDFYIIFADTGLELPEVMENTEEMVKLLGMHDKFKIKHAGDKFWTLVETFGPPARDYRFCCHTLKAEQIMDILKEIGNGKKVLVFLGQRRYESFNRARERRVYVNSFIPLQIAATPIKDWNALEVWLFLLYYPHKTAKGEIKSGIPITPLYFEGNERLGCYLCPAASLYSYKLLGQRHPDLFERWNNWLKKYAERYGFPEEWIKFGLWRFKKVNKNWVQKLRSLGIKYESSLYNRDIPIEVKITQGWSPCVAGGLSLKGKFNIPINLKLLAASIGVLSDEYSYDEELEILEVRTPDGLLNIFPDGSFYIRYKSPEKIDRNIIKDLAGLVIRSHRCINCGVCRKICPSEIIRIRGNEEEGFYYPELNVTSEKKCLHCRKCITHCSLYAKIRDTLPDATDIS